jgi:protein-disulfide isomerase
VLVEEYGDYQCPACGQFDRTIGPRIRQLAAEGRIRFAYHPIAFLGPESVAAANAAVCAADEGRFWDFHAYAFAHQFPENSGALTTEQLLAFGSASGANGSAFETCVRDVTYEGWVGRLTDRAFASGIHSTPTILVDGQPVANPFQAMAAIEAALAGR